MTQEAVKLRDKILAYINKEMQSFIISDQDYLDITADLLDEIQAERDKFEEMLEEDEE
jgi:hypothetical protein